jgi:CheY-like chemotaxis protein
MAHILVAEDTNCIRALLTVCLESAGHTVVAASDGQQALALARRQAVDLFICDLYMPGMAGADVIREFRRTFPDTPVIVASGTDPTSAGAERTEGLLSKPFARDALLSLVEEVLRAARVGASVQT